MKNLIIKEYDLEVKCCAQSSDIGYRGVDFEGKHYLINIYELASGRIFKNRPGHPMGNDAHLKAPERIYELIGYDDESKEAKVKPITNKKLIEKVVIERELRDFNIVESFC